MPRVARTSSVEMNTGRRAAVVLVLALVAVAVQAFCGVHVLWHDHDEGGDESCAVCVAALEPRAAFGEPLAFIVIGGCVALEPAVREGIRIERVLRVGCIRGPPLTAA